MAKTTEQIVTELADREAIRELPQRYCDCVWRGDVDGIVNLFADEGALRFSAITRRPRTKAASNCRRPIRPDWPP